MMRGILLKVSSVSCRVKQGKTMGFVKGLRGKEHMHKANWEVPSFHFYSLANPLLSFAAVEGAEGEQWVGDHVLTESELEGEWKTSQQSRIWPAWARASSDLESHSLLTSSEKIAGMQKDFPPKQCTNNLSPLDLETYKFDINKPYSQELVMLPSGPTVLSQYLVPHINGLKDKKVFYQVMAALRGFVLCPTQWDWRMTAWRNLVTLQYAVTLLMLRVKILLTLKIPRGTGVTFQILSGMELNTVLSAAAKLIEGKLQRKTAKATKLRRLSSRLSNSTRKSRWKY